MPIADTVPLAAMFYAKDRHHEACTALFRRFRGPIIVPALDSRGPIRPVACCCSRAGRPGALARA